MAPSSNFTPYVHLLNTMTVVPTALSPTTSPTSSDISLFNSKSINLIAPPLQLLASASNSSSIPPVLSLWLTYYMPNQQHCTFSPTALKYYLKLPSAQTHHLDALHITITTGSTVTFSSIPTYTNGKLVDYHNFTNVKPICPLLPVTPPQVSTASTKLINRALTHQRLGHISHTELDLMCCTNSLLGLPKWPFPPATTPCPICIHAKFHHPPKGTTLPTSHLAHRKYLHMDFSFRNHLLSIVLPLCLSSSMPSPECFGSSALPEKLLPWESSDKFLISWNVNIAFPRPSMSMKMVLSPNPPISPIILSIIILPSIPPVHMVPL